MATVATTYRGVKITTQYDERGKATHTVDGRQFTGIMDAMSYIDSKLGAV